MNYRIAAIPGDGIGKEVAPWYTWLSFGANFLARWVGFFVVLALVRGMLDFVRRRLGPSS